MIPVNRILELRRRVSAFLLPTLPAGVAMASYLHGHGSLSGRSLGLIVVAAIAAGAYAAVRLLSGVPRELSPMGRLMRGYRA